MFEVRFQSCYQILQRSQLKINVSSANFPIRQDEREIVAGGRNSRLYVDRVINFYESINYSRMGNGKSNGRKALIIHYKLLVVTYTIYTLHKSLYVNYLLHRVQKVFCF